MGHSIDYLKKREAECREAAAHAIDPGVRQTHLRFAEQYAKEARELRAETQAHQPVASPFNGATFGG